MSMAELVEHMKEKEKKPVEDPVVTGSSPQRPPPPPLPAPPIREKSRSRNARPKESTIATPRTQPPSREDSLASTVGYPTPEPPRAHVARTIAREELNRSRSRGGAPEPMLPIAKEEVLSRGRQMTRKQELPMAEKAKSLLKKQEQGINMGEANTHLGRFAKSFAQVNQKSRNAEQAASVPPPRKQKTYNDIGEEIKEVVPDPTDT
jgi:hypothetical protein